MSAILWSEHDTLEKTSSLDVVQVKCPVMKHKEMSIRLHKIRLSIAASNWFGTATNPSYNWLNITEFS
jgi:hypothetical protein